MKAEPSEKMKRASALPQVAPSLRLGRGEALHGEVTDVQLAGNGVVTVLMIPRGRREPPTSLDDGICRDGAIGQFSVACFCLFFLLFLFLVFFSCGLVSSEENSCTAQ